MGVIENLVSKFTVQTCVYWGSPVSDKKGGWTFATPVEIACRWDEKQELKIGYDGNKFSSQAVVLVNIDIDRRGFMYNGTLADFDSSVDVTNPLNIMNAYIVQQFEKIPMIMKDDDFVRTAYLYDQG